MKAEPNLDAARRVVRTALAEDLAFGPDATTAATVPAGATTEAAFTTRQPGVLAGLPLVRLTLDEVIGADRYRVLEERPDGAALAAGDCALRVHAPVRDLLTAERTALNLLCHLSGIATATAAWVRAVAGTGCDVRDSRKTLPGLRALQKYAVRLGGGVNHRMGLGDAVLIKDNHVVAAGSAVAAVRACRAHAPELPMEVEVTDLDELDAVLAEGVELVLLDNFTPEGCAEAVRRTAERAPGTELEASGGLTLEVARAYAETGVRYLAVGGLTHSAPALDLGLDLAEEPPA
ncbi:carboxylating nicotinate-nucleotide diphosphorylase [Saccharopolyspora sp. CA-218241]|uniref:carboxylating nicotinate-nucleotide diphosphorylase n=1 Tax=Saccharopolyspora sp. CA-218241 TaxID=3240027 RepID=UPI003D970155